MIGPDSRQAKRRRGAWAALALVPLLSGCLGAVALPLLAGGTLMVRDRQRVRAATQVPAGSSAAPAASSAVLTSLTELPPPSGTPEAAADDRWRQFFAYVEPLAQPESGARPASALLVQPPDITTPKRTACSALVPAVVIDLDEGSEAFAPERLARAPAEVAAGLARLRQASVVVLWISRLPASRAADVARALRTAGFDPQGRDQLLLIRNGDDRKQALRQDASEDVCVVAVAGDQRSDFDELYDYLRNPETAFALDSMIGQGWFLVPSLSAPTSAAEQTPPAAPSTER
jgi:hypothetical protein